MISTTVKIKFDLRVIKVYPDHSCTVGGTLHIGKQLIRFKISKWGGQISRAVSVSPGKGTEMLMPKQITNTEMIAFLVNVGCPMDVLEQMLVDADLGKIMSDYKRDFLGEITA